MASARARGSRAGTSRPARRSVPTTSGRAPAAFATTASPQAMASLAGKPKPSKKEGTTATRAVEYCSHQLVGLEHLAMQDHALLQAVAADEPHHQAVVGDAAVDDLEA